MKILKTAQTILGIAFISIISLASCKRDKNDNPAPTNNGSTVKIAVASPTDGFTYRLHDTVWIKATVTAPNDLHGYAVALTNKTSNTIVFSADEDVHDKTFSIDTFWINNVADHSDMQLEIDAEIDHNGNKETKTISFHCHPM